MDALEAQRYVYDSGYYRDTISRARLDNPTPMTSRLERPISIQNVCASPTLVWCQLLTEFFAPNLERRTNGALIVGSASFRELGIPGPETLRFLRDGTIDMADMFSPYLAGELPEVEILHLHGLYADRSEQYRATVQMLPHIERLLIDATGGYPININWRSGHDLFLFTRKPLYEPEDLQEMKVRSFSASLSDWLTGMGAEPQFLASAEVYIALERHIIDAVVTTVDGAHQEHWHEITNYINGPVVSWAASYNVINGEIWEGIPKDLQEIIKEEAAKLELEALRVAAIHNEIGLQRNLDAGMTYVEFGPEMRAQSKEAARSMVIPNWVKRIGGPSSPFVELFNRVHDLLLGLRIEEDGTVERLR